MDKKCWMRSIALVAVAVLALMAPASARADLVSYQMVAVGDVGNAADSTGYGAVAYAYSIGKYDVTIGQYTAFLNAVATTDTNGLYNTSMGTTLNMAGISRSGSSGSYSYAVMNNGGSSANRPISFVSWFDAARFANWMANGQPTGAQSATTTEDGAYDLIHAASGTAPAKNGTNPNTSAAPTYWIPTENEWYKAAYYQPSASGGPNDGYWAYSTQSDTAPGNSIGSSANQANYKTASGYAVTSSNTYSASQYYTTDVGAFTTSVSYYGTFDQTGNVYQWNDLDGASGTNRGRRGSYFGSALANISSSYRFSLVATSEAVGTGFRLAGAAPVVVPEIDPAGLGSVVAMLSGVLGLAERRRVRRPPPRSRP